MDKNEKQRIKEIKKQAVKDRKVKKALRVKSFRGLKNFFWWLGGVASSFAILAGTVFVAVGVLPVGTYFGGKEQDAVSENVSSKSLLDVFMSIGELQVSDFKILQDTVDRLFAESGVNEFIIFDKTKFSELKFVYEEGSEKTFGSEIQNCIKISKDLFGDLATIGVFEHTQVPDAEVPTPEQEFAPNLYYYVSSGSVDDDTAVYSRAFNDDKTRVEDSLGKTLYYVALDYLPFGEMKDLIADRLGYVEINHLLNQLGNEMEGSLIGDLLGDLKINGISNFNPSSINLNLFLKDKDELGNPINEQLYDILCGAIVPKPEREESEVTPENLTLGDLMGETGTFSMDGIKLNSFMSESGSETLYDILCGAVTRNDGSEVSSSNITLGDLTGATGTFSMDGIKLSSIIPCEDELGNPLNTDIYDMLCKAIVPKPEREESEVRADNITIGDLTGATGTFNLEGVTINLSTVLNPSTNQVFYNILRDLTAEKYNEQTVENYTEDKHNELIKLDDLSGKDFSTIRLSSVLAVSSDNKLLYDILSDVTGKSSDVITVGHLNAFSAENTGKIKLNRVIPCEDEYGNPVNEQLYDVLFDITNTPAEEITVGSLSNFDVSEVRLATVLPPTTTNASLYKVIRDLTKGKYNEQTVEDYTEGKHDQKILLSDLQSIDVNDLSLTAVLDDTNSANAKLYDIIREATGKKTNAEVTVGSLSSFNIGSVHLTTVIDKDPKDIDNNILKALLEDEAATIANLGESINNLDMSVLYDGECFTTDVNEANVNTVGGEKVYPASYRKITFTDENGTEHKEGYILNSVFQSSPNRYTLTDDGIYYIAKDSHVWLFLLYNYDYNGDNKNADGTVNAAGLLNDHDEYGNAKFYHVYHHKFSALQGDVSHISEEIMHAKIRQLADSGVLEDGTAGYKTSVYVLTMNAVLDGFNQNMP